MNFYSLLTLMLVAFKVLGYINWSWWLVLGGPFGAAFVFLVLAALVSGNSR